MSKKYKVMFISENDQDIAGLKVGDIVTIQKKSKSLYKLPKHLYGKGHTDSNRYKKRNYWYLDDTQLELIE